MALELTEQLITKHRDTTFTLYVHLENARFVDDISMFPAKLNSDLSWWLIPASIMDDGNIADIGPFENVDDAVVFLKLRSELRRA